MAACTPFHTFRMKTTGVQMKSIMNNEILVIPVTVCEDVYTNCTPTTPRSMYTKYKISRQIGEGSYGQVFKATDYRKKCVALKNVIQTDTEDVKFPKSVIREVQILQLLKHENVVGFVEFLQTKVYSCDSSTSTSPSNGMWSTFYIVLEFCEYNLAELLANTNVKFSLEEIKKVMQQLLYGLYYIHDRKILHRDIKPANILITKNGILKIADFGLSRAYSDKKNGQANGYTNKVVTLCYRPPELLLGDRNYGPLVDLWSAGCVMAEMWYRSPIMPGKTEQQQLTLISRLCGSITPEVWPGVENLELFTKMELPRGQKRNVKESLKPYEKDPFACDLLDRLLMLDPTKRLDSDNALNHDFFWNDPMPCGLSKMLAKHTQSMSQHTQSMFEY